MNDSVRRVILLVDDEEDLVSVLQDAVGLSLPDYEAVSSTSAEDAEAALASLSDDAELCLICVDHRLGGRTGLDLLETLHARYPDVPCILYTGQATSGEEERARRVGARVLYKPIGLRAWLGEVQSMLIPAA